jgi:hypothetical protein
VFGREEGVKDTVQKLGGDSAPCIGHLDLDVRLSVRFHNGSRLDVDFAAFVSGLDGVDQDAQ